VSVPVTKHPRSSALADMAAEAKAR